MITIQQEYEPNRFPQANWLITPVANARHLINLAGVVVVNIAGTSNAHWRREEVAVVLSLVEPLKRAGLNQEFLVEQWTQLVTPNAWYNQDNAVDHGVAVDWTNHGPEPADSASNVSSAVWTMRVHVAIRDNDAILYRLGYHVSLLGRVVDGGQRQAGPVRP